MTPPTLVLGGTGFIGRGVVRRLVAEGADVWVLHRGRATDGRVEGARYLEGSRDDPQTLEGAFEAAGELGALVDMIAMTESQATATATRCARAGVRPLVISSADVYAAYDGLLGHGAPPLPTGPNAEDAPLRARRYPYRGLGLESPHADDYDKILVEEGYQAVCPETTVLRLPKVWGPHDGQRTVQSMADALRAADGVHTLAESQAAWRWTCGYVEDVAAAIAACVAADRARGETYNVGEAQPAPQHVWYARVAEAIGWRGTLQRGPDQDDGHDWRYHLETDTSKLRGHVSLPPETSPREGLERTLTGEGSQPGGTGAP